MATRTSTRTTKAVKFVDSAEDEENEEFENTEPTPIKDEPKKTNKARGRPKRTRSNDEDEEWNAQNAPSDDDEEEDDATDDEEENHPKKYKPNQSNRSGDSVYDFGYE